MSDSPRQFVREVTLDSRGRLALTKITNRRYTRYLVTPHADESITLTPMKSVLAAGIYDGMQEWGADW